MLSRIKTLASNIGHPRHRRPSHRLCTLEQMEQRQLMAGDFAFAVNAADVAFNNQFDAIIDNNETPEVTMRQSTGAITEILSPGDRVQIDLPRVEGISAQTIHWQVTNNALPSGLRVGLRDGAWQVDGELGEDVPVGKQSFTLRGEYAGGSIDAQVHLLVDQDLNLWTQNAALLPHGLVGTPNSEEDNEQRGDEIVRRAGAFDIVGLQEVFDAWFADDVFDRVRDGARSAGFETHEGPGDAFAEISSGLLLLVDGQLSSQSDTTREFVFQEEGPGIEAWAQKGASLTTVHLGPDPNDYVYVVNTHLSAPQGSAADRAGQLQEIREFVDSHTDPRHPVIFMGDFNVRARSSEYAQMLNILGNPEDVFAGINPFTSDSTTNIYAHQWGDDPGRKTLDYILIRQGTDFGIDVDGKQREDAPFTTFKCRDGRRLPGSGWLHESSLTHQCYVSDHYGLSAEVRFVEYASLDSSSGELIIRGSDDNDSIAIDQADDTIIVSGRRGSVEFRDLFHANQVESISVHAGDGHDTINIERLAELVDLTVHAGKGNDVVHVARNSRQWSNVLGPTITTFGGDGIDNVYVHDDASNTGTSYTVSDHSINRIFASPVAYYEMEGLDLDTAKNGNTIRIESTSEDVPVRVKGGSGNDTFHIGTSSMDTIRSNVSVNGRSGWNDRMVVHDQDAYRFLNHVLPVTYEVGNGVVTHKVGLFVTRNTRLMHSGLEQIEILAGPGNDQFDLTSLRNVPSFSMDMGPGNDTLLAPRYETNSFHLTGRNSGHLNNVISFQGTENLVGGSYNDRFIVNPGASLSGSANAELGNDTLDYSWHTQDVTVNLNSGIATGIASGVAGFENVMGGYGNDTLTGSDARNILRGSYGNDEIDGLGGDDVLIGGSQNDTLVGGNDNDVLIGGLGRDNLSGNTGDDLLIAGSTSYDAIDSALLAISNEWKSSRSYTERIGNLRNGVGASGYRLDSSTVVPDRVIDQLTGGLGQDWFWNDPQANSLGFIVFDSVWDAAHDETVENRIGFMPRF